MQLLAAIALTATLYLPIMGGGNSMAFPNCPIIDDFNRPDGGLGANWTTTEGSPVVDGNEAANTDPADPGGAMWTAGTFGPNCEVYATFTTRQTNTGVNNLYARWDDPAAPTVGYTLQVYRFDGVGDTLNLCSMSTPDILVIPIADLQDGDAAGMQLSGTTINVFYKPVGGSWSLVGTIVDSETAAAGYVGFSLNDTTARMDDFGACDYTPPTPPQPWRQGTGRAKSGGTRSGKIQDVAAYSITTPDGVTTDLRDKGFTVGIGDIQDGMGLPPVEHKTWQLFNNPGALLRSIQVGPRVVTINASLDADCLQSLHDLRNKLWQSLRWNRTLSDPPDPAILHYTLNGRRADLYVYYAGDITARIGNSNVDQTIGVRLIAYDPLWYGPTEKTSTVSLSHGSTNLRTIVGRFSHVWNVMGPPDPAGAYTAVFALAEDETYIYVGGEFANFDNIANADNIVRYNKAAGTWSAMGTGMDLGVYAIEVGPDGMVYAGGLFTTAGGGAALRVAMWNPVTGAWSALGAGMNNIVYALAFSDDGTLYAGGDFTTAGGGAALRVASWDGTAWAALGAGMDAAVWSLAFSKAGTLFAGGNFTTADGNPAAKIAEWNPVTSVWSTLSSGTDGIVYTLVIADNGDLYAGGAFTTAGGVTVNRVARWNGSAWFELAGGTDDVVWKLTITQDGLLIVGGAFTQAGTLILADRLAVWNGSSWAQADIDLPGVATIYALYGSKLGSTSDLYIGFDTVGADLYSNPMTPTTLGDFETFPIITITGPGTLQHIINTTSGDYLIFDLYINPREVITIDLSPGVKDISSSWLLRPSAMAALSLPQSDLGSWSLKPDPVAPGGVNNVSVFITDTVPAEYNDNGNQLSDWADITGITCLNVDADGAIYASIVADGGGFYHVELYEDQFRLQLIGHTASYNAGGAQAILPDNASGLGGTITIDAATGADVDIIVYYATICIRFYDRHLSVDHAMQ